MAATTTNKRGPIIGGVGVLALAAGFLVVKEGVVL